MHYYKMITQVLPTQIRFFPGPAKLNDSTRMSFKSAPYLHQKSVHWALNDALVLMLLVPNTTIKTAVSA